MQYPIVMSVLISQDDQDAKPHASVVYGWGGCQHTRQSGQFTLDEVSDATDLKMWAQMVAARLCDAL